MITYTQAMWLAKVQPNMNVRALVAYATNGTLNEMFEDLDKREAEERPERVAQQEEWDAIMEDWLGEFNSVDHFYDEDIPF